MTRSLWIVFTGLWWLRYVLPPLPLLVLSDWASTQCYISVSIFNGKNPIGWANLVLLTEEQGHCPGFMTCAVVQGPCAQRSLGWFRALLLKLLTIMFELVFCKRNPLRHWRLSLSRGGKICVSSFSWSLCNAPNTEFPQTRGLWEFGEPQCWR